MRALALVALLAGCAPAPSDGDQTQGQLGDPAAPAAVSRKHALVIGGAASADTPIDYFGAWTAREVAALDAGGYATTVLFSDGLNDIPIQAEALAQLAQRSGGVPAAFTTENLDAALGRLVANVTRGDEVLVVVATHGFACDGWSPPPGSDPNVAAPEAFCIALGAPQPASGYAELRFDALSPSLAQLHDLGATTGILVSTCDSGNALRLADDRTCVVSATGYETSRRTAFFDSWLDHAKGGMTLRAAYHAALPFTNDYEQCQVACPDDMTQLCPGPCAYYDTPWLSAEQGYPAAACDAFVL